MAGLYIHIPFCSRKCGYCAFYSVVGLDHNIDRFLTALELEARSRVSELTEPLNSIYIGGGTPSLLDSSRFERLNQIIEDNFPLRATEMMEYTIEVNPDDVEDRRIQAWYNAGVNRVSMGIQSMITGELKIIGRRHTSDEAIRAFWKLRRFFSNISLDIIFGLPSQTMESWIQSVEAVVSLAPDHISAYSLTYEERTKFSRMLSAGEILATDENICGDMFDWLCQKMAKEGYEHYEISNFAIPSKRSLHNSSYWNGSPYLGLGPSAASYDGYRTRRSNPPTLKGFLQYFTSPGENESYVHTEILSKMEIVEEYIMTRLRTVEGIDMRHYNLLFGENETSRLIDRAKRFGNEWVAMEEGCLRLTEKGFFISDEIIVALLPD